MEQNPYETPVFAHEHPPIPADAPVKVFDLAAAKQTVRLPALLMMSAAVMALPIDLALFCHALFSALPEVAPDLYTIDGATLVVCYIFACGSFLGLHSFVVFGAYQMYRLRNAKYARLAMALCVCPFVSPVYLLGMPGGIWAHVVLSKANVSDAFEV